MASDTSRTLLRSQGGPLAGIPFSCCFSSFHSRLTPQVFRVLLFRRLWLPLPPTKRTCGCGHLLDFWPPPRSVRQRGSVGRRGFALESAAAHVCREAGARVSVNQLVRDLDITMPMSTATVATRRRKDRRYPELSGDEGRAVGCEVGSRRNAAQSSRLRTNCLCCNRGLHRWGGDFGLQRRPRFLDVAGAARNGPPFLNHDVLWEARYFV